MPAAFSLRHSLGTINLSKPFARRKPTPFPVCRSHHSPPPPPPESKERKEVGRRDWTPWKMFREAVKLSKELKESLLQGPKQKGDWKDVILMSFSFAVYVYISQRIVCTYCAWISTLSNHF
ncbi:hypothetical protein KSP39_PZI005100 [Platanthera zijinensis]|uniref:Uncharacterized protein n=1 Tax=Platanthera zijinensis TaxID=2320716 RepID=A0AAP0BTN5_9ASPA